MIRFVKKLRQLLPSGNITESGPVTVLLTGLSSLHNANLSHEQMIFLQTIAPDNTTVLPCNFPYHTDFISHSPSSSSLFTASLLNGMQFILATFSSRYAKLIASRLHPLLEKRQEKMVIITGSCGLALFNAALPYLQIKHLDKLLVIALGPVNVKLKTHAYKLYQIRGTKDWVSKMLKSGHIDYTVECGHLEYYHHRQTQHIVRSLCEKHFA